MQKRSPGSAAVLSFFIIGLGQIYNGQIGKAVLLWLAECFLLGILGISLALWLLFPIAGIWIGGMIDAYNTADEANAEKEAEERARERRMRDLITKQRGGAVSTGRAQERIFSHGEAQSACDLCPATSPTKESTAVRESRRAAWEDFRKLQNEDSKAESQ